MNEQSLPPTITTIAEFSQLIESEFKSDKLTNVIYRGHGAVSFKLIPKVGRFDPPESSKEEAVNEELMLELFRRQSVDRIETVVANDWERLAIAQHHGLPTRLLDWTRSPLVALYFAVCKEFETRHEDGRPKDEAAEIIAWRCEKISLADNLPDCGPLDVSELIRYIPPIVTPRLRAQAGLFTVHPDPKQEFKPKGECIRIQIPNVKRKCLKKSLFRHGIHEGVLFPDLDGLARHIQWCQTKCY